MNETEQALTEAVAKAVEATMPFGVTNAVRIERGYYDFTDSATAAIAAVRAHDEQAALNCGFCTPNADEIACACQIEERDDE